MAYTDHIGSVYTYHSTHKGQPMIICVDFSAITTPEFSKTLSEGWFDRQHNDKHYELTGSVLDHLLKLVQIANHFWEQYAQELEEDLLTQAGYMTHIFTLYDNYMNYCH